MGFLIMIATAVGGIIGAIGLGLLKDEATAWLPTLNRIILAAAGRRVPEELRERYAEEWAAHVLEYPGKLSQIAQCLRCFFAGSAMEELSAKQINRMMMIFVAFAGIGMETGLLLERYREVSFWVHHLLGFVDFSANVVLIWMMVWFIWRRPQVLKLLRMESSEPPLP